MSGTYPLTVRPGMVDFRGFKPTDASTAHSLKRQTRYKGAHRWYLKLTYFPMTRAEWSPITAFLDEQNGQADRFSVVVPGMETARGGVSGSPLSNGAQAAGLTSVSIKSLPLSITGVFKAGDLITFANHLKVYEVTRDANSNGSGVATVYLNCPLMSALVNNEAVTYASVAMKVALVNDTVARSWKGGIVCPGFEVEMIEDPYA